MQLFPADYARLNIQPCSNRSRKRYAVAAKTKGSNVYDPRMNVSPTREPLLLTPLLSDTRVGLFLRFENESLVFSRPQDRYHQSATLVKCAGVSTSMHSEVLNVDME